MAEGTAIETSKPNSHLFVTLSYVLVVLKIFISLCLLGKSQNPFKIKW